MNLADWAVIATGPSGFPGASQIMCQYLRELANAGCTVHYVGFQKPFFFNTVDCPAVGFHILRPLTAEAIGDSRAVQSADVLFAEQLVECMLQIAGEALPRKRLLIWGTYLLPYGRAALDVSQALSRRGLNSRLWLTPAGSDIWELGKSLRRVIVSLLSDSHVERVVTYTEQFANEILALCGEGEKLPIKTLYPIVDFSRFHPLDTTGRRSARAAHGIDAHSFVITSHSNMRPVKAPEDVVHISRGVASAVKRQVVLLLIGPAVALPTGAGDPNLDIRRTGIVERVEKLLQISDLELNCSRHDSFNLSLAEAMACGVPCATTDVVGIATEIRQSGGGLLFPVEPQDAIRCTARYREAISAVAGLAENEILRGNLGRAALQGARSAFSADRILPKLMDLVIGARC